MGRVTGKVAIVTGAARGMGAMHARRLVEEGAKVVLTDVLDEDGAAAAEALGANARFRRLDVTKEAEWKDVVAQAESTFGPVSVLVNNAGVVWRQSIETLEEADYRRVIDVNQISVFLGMKSVLPSMKRAGGGSIINISSTAGLVGVPTVMAYAASKFAVRGMTKVAALEFAPYQIRVNSVHPGMIRTPMILPDETEGQSGEYDRIMEIVRKTTPLGRVGEPEEVSNVVLMLASDECRFATGSEFVVDGGWTCL